MKAGYSLTLIAISVAVSLFPMSARAQYTGNIVSTSPLQTIVAPILDELLTSSSAQLMEQQFLQNHPNFQQENQTGYSLLLSNPQAFFNEGKWLNYQNGETLEQRVQEVLQLYPNLQQENPQAYNMLINDPQSFFTALSQRQKRQKYMYRQNYLNQQNYYQQNYLNQPNYLNRQNYLNQSEENTQQRVQSFLQRHPNFQQENPTGYNQLINDPQTFFTNMHHNRGGEQSWQNQGNYNNNWTNSYQTQSQYGQEQYGDYQNY